MSLNLMVCCKFNCHRSQKLTDDIDLRIIEEINKVKI